MKLPIRDRLRSHPRGQALVEMAMLLPLLLLLLVMALDLGRVFFGWVALHNSVRIGADYAAGHAEWWDGMKATYADERQGYEDLVQNDLQSLNCVLPSPDPVPEPTFAGFADGDLVQGEVTCAFELITPLAENLFGGPISMTVRADFPVNRTVIAGLPGGGGPPPPPPCTVPDALIATTPAESGGQVNINSGQTVTLTDSSASSPDCPITAWQWDFGDGTPQSTAQGPHNKIYVHLGPSQFRNYTVSLTATNSLGSDTDTVVIRVRRP